MSDHAIVHVEISANDSVVTGKFYSDLFGWKTAPMPGFESYVTFAPQSGPSGGFPQVDGENARPWNILLYISTDDIDASLAKAESLGGTTAVPKTQIPGVGWFGVFTDPSGNHIGLFTA